MTLGVARNGIHAHLRRGREREIDDRFGAFVLCQFVTSASQLRSRERNFFLSITTGGTKPRFSASPA